MRRCVGCSPLVPLQLASGLEQVYFAVLAKRSLASYSFLLPQHKSAVHGIVDGHQAILIYSSKATLIGGRIKGALSASCHIIATSLASDNVGISDPDCLPARVVRNWYRSLLNVSLDALELNEMVTS